MRILIASVIFGDSSPPSANYSNAVEKVGGTAFFCGYMNESAAERAALEYDGLILSGGLDMDGALFGQETHPAAQLVPKLRDQTELILAKSFIGAEKPILAICRGIQTLNVSLGGDLIQHIGDCAGCFNHADRESRHDIFLERGGLLSDIFAGHEKLRVNSTHHQAVRRLGKGLSISARSEDGIIESVHLGKNILGVQFHPERLLDEGMMPLWEWFAAECSF